jgi:hypothetical protein
MDRVRFGSESAEITSGVHGSAENASCTETFDRAIHGKTLRDPAQIKRERLSKTNAVTRFQDDIPKRSRCICGLAWRQIAPLTQERRNRDVERTAASHREVLSAFQNLPGPFIHPHRLVKRVSIQPADVARRIVKAHQPMHASDGGEASLQAPPDTGLVLSPAADFHVRAE